MSNLSRDDVLAIVAHELRTPLGSVLNAVEVMRQGERSGAGLTSWLEIIARQTRYMSRLVDDLVDLSRMSREGLMLRKERLDLRRPIDAAIEATWPFIQVRGHKLEVDLSSEPIWMNGDPTRLQQVVANLLLNSAEYTEAGGHIDVKLEQSSTFAVLRVRDTGIGILPEALERIFEPFTRSRTDFRASHDGLGIGLAVVRSVVEQHGGVVEARSAGLHRGSEFIVRLPTLPPEEVSTIEV